MDERYPLRQGEGRAEAAVKKTASRETRRETSSSSHRTAGRKTCEWLTAEELDSIAEAVGEIEPRYRALILFMDWTAFVSGKPRRPR